MSSIKQEIEIIGNLSGNLSTSCNRLKNVFDKKYGYDKARNKFSTLSHILSCQIDTLQKKDINFYDYDGTIFASYTRIEFLSYYFKDYNLPTAPDHSNIGIEFYSYSHDLGKVLDLLLLYGYCDVQAFYRPTAGSSVNTIIEFVSDVQTQHQINLFNYFSVVNNLKWVRSDGTSGTTTTFTVEAGESVTCYFNQNGLYLNNVDHVRYLYTNYVSTSDSNASFVPTTNYGDKLDSIVARTDDSIHNITVKSKKIKHFAFEANDVLTDDSRITASGCTELKSLIFSNIELDTYISFNLEDCNSLTFLDISNIPRSQSQSVGVDIDCLNIVNCSNLKSIAFWYDVLVNGPRFNEIQTYGCKSLEFKFYSSPSFNEISGINGVKELSFYNPNPFTYNGGVEVNLSGKTVNVLPDHFSNIPYQNHVVIDYAFNNYVMREKVNGIILDHIQMISGDFGEEYEFEQDFSDGYLEELYTGYPTVYYNMGSNDMYYCDPEMIGQYDLIKWSGYLEELPGNNDVFYNQYPTLLIKIGYIENIGYIYATLSIDASGAYQSYDLVQIFYVFKCDLTNYDEGMFSGDVDGHQFGFLGKMYSDEGQVYFRTKEDDDFTHYEKMADKLPLIYGGKFGNPLSSDIDIKRLC